MSKMTAREEKISDFFSDLNKKARLVTFADFDVDDADDADDVFEWYYDHQDYVVGEVIYYATAMEFLEENDVTLSISLELAGDMGYDCGSLNSELLATILKYDMANQEMEEFRSEIEDFFDDLEDED